MGAGSFPANVVDGMRWNAALAYLDACRSRPNLTVRPDTLVDRVVLRDGRAVGVVDDEGHVHEAAVVVLAAGAYFSPAILLRSGIGPEAELNRLAIPVASDLPVGERLLDHCGVNAAWAPSRALRDDTERRTRGGELFAPHALLKAASSACPPAGVGPASRHLDRRERRAGRLRGERHGLPHEAVVARSTPASVPRSVRASAGRARLPLGPGRPPRRRRGARARASARRHGSAGRAPGGRATPRASRSRRLRPSTISGYFHPAGTCALGEVVDPDGRVLGIDGLIVADASIMPTIPRANTNLTTAAIAERIADDRLTSADAPGA